MAKKEYVKLTPEGLNLITVLNNSNIGDVYGLYEKEIFLTDGFAGNTQYLFQCFGNIGARVRSTDLDKDILYIIISNQMIKSFSDGEPVPFIVDLENRLNQDNSPYRKIKLLTEEHIVWYFEYRAKINGDKQLADLIRKYKESKKDIIQEKTAFFE